MLRVHTTVSCVVRHRHLQPSLSHVSILRHAFSRKPLPISFPRKLSISSSPEPIKISSSRQEVTIRLKDGTTVVRKISPTPKAKTDKLAEALGFLLLAPEPNPTARPTFGCLQWELDTEGDAIHRHIALSSPGECERVLQRIMAVADEVNHHPHIAQGKEGEESCMTITCTTHSPRGLSVRDTRLAKTINKVLECYDVMRPAHLGATADLEQAKARIAAQRERTIDINRQAISEALASCACDRAKS